MIFDEGRRLRVFCPDRYTLSLHLPGAVRQLCNPRSYVWQTAAERNWLYQKEVEVSVGGDRVMYQLFFAVQRAARAKPYDVEMMVESAYAVDPRRPPRLQGRALMVCLPAATVEGRQLHTAGSRRNR